MRGPSLEPIHTDALRRALKDEAFVEALRRVIEEETRVLSEDLRAHVSNGSFHNASVVEGMIQGMSNAMDLLGKFKG